MSGRKLHRKAIIGEHIKMQQNYLSDGVDFGDVVLRRIGNVRLLTRILNSDKRNNPINIQTSMEHK